MSDHFKDHTAGLSSPAHSARHVTPSDSATLPDYSRALFVGGAGSLSVELVGNPGAAITLAQVQPGVIYPLRVRKVLSTALRPPISFLSGKHRKSVSRRFARRAFATLTRSQTAPSGRFSLPGT